MVYGYEAMLPTDLDYGSLRILAFDEQGNELVLENVKARSFNFGDLVLCQVLSNKDKHKVSLPLEGPFIVSRVIRPDSFKLKTLKG